MAANLDYICENLDLMRLWLSSIAFLLTFGALAQFKEPVKWKYNQKQVDAQTFELAFEATIDKGWHMYSQFIAEGGPIPSSFEFKPNKAYQKVGKVEEIGKAINTHDPVFDMPLTFFENKVVFVQKVKLLSPEATVKGTFITMACNDRECLPPDERDFTFTLKAETIGLNPETLDTSKIATTLSKNDTLAADKADTTHKTSIAPVKPLSANAMQCDWLAVFIAGFLGGLLALLTPCVFPMIPLTVSFFTKQSKTRAKGITNAILYGISIIVIYVSLTFGVTQAFGPDALNSFSTNVWVNLAFFALFVVFAVSFFGAFEITLPSSWINKADQASERGGLLGIFFMAFTLSLVSFSCTGPIIGTLLVETAVNGGILCPLMGMLGFSAALALPFTLFAIFPGWLNSLPKSGGWLNTVKVTLGFLELALALKFLSNADLVVQAHLLEREVFLAIWIAIGLSLTFYLFGLIRFSHDAQVQHLSIPRFLIGLTTLIFTIYLIPGLWGAPLKLISGFPPPQFYSESPTGLPVTALGSNLKVSATGTKASNHGPSCPLNLNCFHDYDEALMYAKQVNKPLLVDFTGWACVNCRKMEENVWSDPSVLDQIKNDYVLVSLYVDEKTPLDPADQKEVKIGSRTKMLKTVGNKWSYLQTSRYNTNTQPYYVLLNHNEQQLVPANAYDPDIPHFAAWLKSGYEAFHKKP